MQAWAAVTCLQLVTRPATRDGGAALHGSALVHAVRAGVRARGLAGRTSDTPVRLTGLPGSRARARRGPHPAQGAANAPSACAAQAGPAMELTEAQGRQAEQLDRCAICMDRRLQVRVGPLPASPVQVRPKHQHACHCTSKLGKAAYHAGYQQHLGHTWGPLTQCWTAGLVNWSAASGSW